MDYRTFGWDDRCEKIVANIKRTKTLPIIVYQMGKVGSSTIIHCLEALNLNQSIWHAHFMREDFDNYIKENKLLHKTIIKLLKSIRPETERQKLKIITLVRDPIARNISFYFELIDNSYGAIPSLSDLSKDGKLNIEEALERFYHVEEVHGQYLNWFDLEMKPSLDFDIFKQPFLKSQGYQIYNQKDFDLLVIKTERINECINKAFYDFLGVDNAKVILSNVRAERKFANAYVLFKKRLKIDPDYVDLMYNSKVATHFYSDQELNQFKQKWIKK